jgi:hypothetical protein
VTAHFLVYTSACLEISSDAGRNIFVQLECNCCDQVRNGLPAPVFGRQDACGTKLVHGAVSVPKPPMYIEIKVLERISC